VIRSIIGENMNAIRLKADLFLLLAAFVWGSGFVAQRVAAVQMSAFTFNGWRFLIAAVVIYAVTYFTRATRSAEPVQRDPRKLAWMILAGALLFSAAGLQQAGLATTTISNVSFITGLYVVMVPLILSLVWRQRVTLLSWIAVILSVIGVMLLSLQGELRLNSGDTLALAGALMWAFQIILVGWLARQGVDVLHFSVVQFATCGILNLGLAIGLEGGNIFSVSQPWIAVLYSALFPIALGFTLQIAGQRHAPTVDATIIMSTEAVFGTLFGFLFLGELLTTRQAVGCALIMAAMILAQLRPGAPMQMDAA
jgi:drug/metabolite transporter (DMT)-like permease